MSQGENELDWDNYDGVGYGSIKNKNKDEDFDNIKINLNDSNGKKALSDSKVNNKPGEIRKSELSTGSGSNEEKKQANQENGKKKGIQCCNCLHLEYYRQYFEVTTQDVLQRILFSLIPIGDKLAQAIGENPDFYGPFWIYATLLFILTFSENFHNYLAVEKNLFKSDFGNVVPSCLTIYGVGFGVPLGLSFLLKYITGGDLKFREIACIYGYSFTSIMICVLFCSIPFSILQWILIAITLVFNMLVLFFNLKKHLDSSAPKAKWIVVGSICLIQIALMMVFKFVFLHQISKDE